MKDNSSLYSILFNAITDAVAEMEAQNFGLRQCGGFHAGPRADLM